MTELGPLPEEWDVVPLGDVMRQRKEFVRIDDSRAYKRCRVQVRGKGIILRDTVHGRSLRTKQQQVCQAGEFLVAEIDAKVGGFGIVPPDLEGAIVSSHYFLFHLDAERLARQFLHYHVRLPQFLGQVQARGSTNYASVRPKHVLGYTIPLPPIAKQHAIAQTLDRVQEAIAATERVIAAARELKKSLMKHLFTYGPVPIDQADQVSLKETEIGPVPEDWAVIQLGEVAKVGNGATPKRTNPGYWDNGSIPWLTSGKIHEGIIEHADEFVTEGARAECHLPLVPAGSLLVAITGQGKTLGSAAQVTFDTCVSQHLAYVRFEKPVVGSGFLLSFLRSRYKDFRRVSDSGGSTKGALTCAYLRAYPIPLPPADDQEVIAATLGAVERKLKSEMCRRSALESLFKTLLHLLMTGQVRVKDWDLPAKEEAAT